MVDTFKPGQVIRCTVQTLPQAEAPVDTILRLMRRDPVVVRALRKSQQLRRRNTLVYNRGNRDWVQRRACGKVVRMVKGAQWAFVFDLGMAKDLKSVEKYIKIEAA
jgi:hypothetical protein